MSDVPPTGPDTATDGPTEGAAGTALMEELAEVQKQRDEYLDQLQRSRAEFFNYQKRAKAQADLDRQYAVSSLACDLLGVLDNLERAIEAARKAGNPTIVEGVELVQRQFLAALAKHGIEPIPALDQPFDPNLHDALTRIPDSNRPEGTVAAEFGRGYRHHDRVLRPARVGVTHKP
jgi:molecular chaperone GrpE